MSLVELGRYDRNLANIIVGRLDAEGIDAIAFDGGRASPMAAISSFPCG